jgi:DNA-binding HxlR family transcriptional regulator
MLKVSNPWRGKALTHRRPVLIFSFYLLGVITICSFEPLKSGSKFSVRRIAQMFYFNSFSVVSQVHTSKLEVNPYVMYNMCMTTRSYNQFCALASALDYVGERWTLLIIRELLIGPRRFKDLLLGLPCISTNLLAERLKTLGQQGMICQRVLPPPAGSTVYELTALGRSLEKPILELGRWGARLLPDSLEGIELPSLGSIAVAIKAFFRPDLAVNIDETYELRFEEESLQVQIKQGEITAQQGTTYQRSDAVFHTNMRAFLGLFTGRITPDDAISGGLVRIEGDPQALCRFLSVSGLSAAP